MPEVTLKASVTGQRLDVSERERIVHVFDADELTHKAEEFARDLTQNYPGTGVFVRGRLALVVSGFQGMENQNSNVSSVTVETRMKD